METKTQVINYKIYYYGSSFGPDVRCLSIDQAVCHNYTHLTNRIIALFPILRNVSFRIYFKDKKGHKIRIDSDDELLIALCEMDSDDFKKLYIYPAKLLRMNFNNFDQGDDYHQRRREAIRPMSGFPRPQNGTRRRVVPVLIDEVHEPIIVLPPPMEGPPPFMIGLNGIEIISPGPHRIELPLPGHQRIVLTSSGPGQIEISSPVPDHIELPLPEPPQIEHPVPGQRRIMLSSPGPHQIELPLSEPPQIEHPVPGQRQIVLSSPEPRQIELPLSEPPQSEHPVPGQRRIMLSSPEPRQIELPLLEPPQSEHPVPGQRRIMLSSPGPRQIELPLSEPHQIELPLPEPRRIELRSPGPQMEETNVSDDATEEIDRPGTTLTTVPLSRLLADEDESQEVTVRYGYMGDPQQQYPVYIRPPSPQDDISLLDDSWTLDNDELDDSFIYEPLPSYPSLSSVLSPTQQKCHDTERLFSLPVRSPVVPRLSPIEETMRRLQLLGFQNEDWLRAIVVNKNGNMNEVLQFLTPIMKSSIDLH